VPGAELLVSGTMSTPSRRPIRSARCTSAAPAGALEGSCRHFSWWMTSMLHTPAPDDPDRDFLLQMQLTRLQ
jgi:hypothetical protein